MVADCAELSAGSTLLVEVALESVSVAVEAATVLVCSETEAVAVSVDWALAAAAKKPATMTEKRILRICGIVVYTTRERDN